MKPITYVVAAALLAVAGGGVTAQPSSASSKSNLSALDKDYLKATAQSNLEEIVFAPVVASHAGSPQVRQFGQRMKQDHAQANAQLKQVAARTGYALPQDVSDDEKDIMKGLARFHGAAFDAAYKKEMVRDHTSDIAETKRELSLGRDPQVVASARKNLALLQMHLKMSRALPNR